MESLNYIHFTVMWLVATIYAIGSIIAISNVGNGEYLTGNRSNSLEARFDPINNDSEKRTLNISSELTQPLLRNVFPDSYFCGKILGGHYMFGSASAYCGGYTIRDCSALCFYQNFTYFQCEGFVCHCYSQ